MNWIKCESKNAWLLKGQDGGWGEGEGAVDGVGGMLMYLQFQH